MRYALFALVPISPIVLGLAAACSKVDPVVVSPDVITKLVSYDNALDLLLVIDNSRSTVDKQQVFAQNMPNFVAALAAMPSGLPSLHIGVVDTTVDIGVDGYGPACPSPDPGDNGLLQNTAQVAGCTPPAGRYIADLVNADGTRITNYGSGDLGSELQCIAVVGDNGCGFEAQLEAMKRALDASNPANAGFLRDGVPLAVVILTDEDDASVDNSEIFGPPELESDFALQPLVAYTCDRPISATDPGSYAGCKVNQDGPLHDPAEYVSFLASVKDPSMTYVGLVAGDPTEAISTGPLEIPGTNTTQPLALLPSCMATINGNPAIARPGIRLSAFEQAFGDNGAFATVCQADYSQVLDTFVQGMSAMMAPCLTGPVSTVDVDPSNPGVQLPCTVADVTSYDTPAQTETPIPRCAMETATMPTPGQDTCWWASQSPKCATTTTGLLVNIVRSSPPAAGTLTQISCIATD
jgi:hypothetical protein